MGKLQINGNLSASGTISSGNGSLVMSTSGSLATYLSTTGGWARGWSYVVNDTSMGGFGFYGSGSTKVNSFYIGSYDTPWMSVTPAGVVTATTFSGNATKVNVTDTTPTSATSYYLLYTSGRTTGQTVRANQDLFYYDAGSYGYLNIGSDNQYGGLTLKSGKGAGIYTDITAQNATAHRTISFPDCSGTILTTGNYSSYCLPLSGGTMSGTITMNTGTGIQMKYEAGKDTRWIYPNGADTYGIRYYEGEPDRMAISASGNNNKTATADLCINGNGDGTVTIRGKTILHAGNYSSYSLPLSGGTMNNGAQIKRAGQSSSWYNGRDHAMIRQHTINGYSPILSIKSTNGSWEMGCYDQSSYADQLLFNYKVDSEYNAGTPNTVVHAIRLSSAGHMTLSSGLTVSNRIYTNEWIEFSGSTGLYWPNNYGCHLFPNVYTSYGSFSALGSKGGYGGFILGNNTNYMHVMSGDNHQGLYNENRGKWIIYFSRSNNLIGIGTSDLVSGYNVTIQGATYLKGRIVVAGDGSSYNEGIRVLPASNGWSNIFFSANSTTSDTHDGGWLVGRRGAAGSSAGAIGDFTIEEQNSNGSNFTIYKNSGGARLMGALTANGAVLANRGSSASTSGYTQSALEIREYAFGGSQADTWGIAPRLSFHWSGRVCAQIGLASNGKLYINNNANVSTTFVEIQGTAGYGSSLPGSGYPVGTVFYKT